MNKLNLKNPEVWFLMECIIDNTLDAPKRKLLDKFIQVNDLRPIIDCINSVVSGWDVKLVEANQISIEFTYCDEHPSEGKKKLQYISSRLARHTIKCNAPDLSYSILPTGYYDKRKEDKDLWLLILCYHSFLNIAAIESKHSFSLLLSKEDRNQPKNSNSKMIGNMVWDTMFNMVDGNMDYNPSVLVSNCTKFLGKSYLDLVRNHAKTFTTVIQSEIQGDEIIFHVGTENLDFIKLLVDDFIIDGNDIKNDRELQTVRGNKAFVMAIYHHITNVVTGQFIIDTDKNLNQFRNPDEPRDIVAEPKINPTTQSLIIHRVNKLIALLKSILDGYTINYSTRLLMDDVRDLNHHIELLFSYLTSYNVGFTRNPVLLKSCVCNESHAPELAMELINQLSTHLEKLLDPEFVNSPDILYYAYLNELDLKTALVLSATETD